VERMDGWIDEGNRQGEALRTTFAEGENFALQRKGRRLDDEGKGTCTGCSRWSSHTVTNGSKGHRLMQA
jgi:hypothetical protein